MGRPRRRNPFIASLVVAVGAVCVALLLFFYYGSTTSPTPRTRGATLKERQALITAEKALLSIPSDAESRTLLHTFAQCGCYDVTVSIGKPRFALLSFSTDDLSHGCQTQTSRTGLAGKALFRLGPHGWRRVTSAPHDLLKAFFSRPKPLTCKR